MAYKKKLTKKRMDKFLEILSKTANVSTASKAVSLNRSNAYVYRNRDPDFAKKWDDVIEEATDKLESEARRRALDGYDEPVYYQGEVCGVVRKYSDTLLIFLLKAHRPKKFTERWQIEGGDTPLNINIVKFGDTDAATE